MHLTDNFYLAIEKTPTVYRTQYTTEFCIINTRMLLEKPLINKCTETNDIDTLTLDSLQYDLHPLY